MTFHPYKNRMDIIQDNFYNLIMKKNFFILSFIYAMIMASCGTGSIKTDESMTQEESQAVIKTEKSLPRGAKMESYEVVKTTMPLALLDTEYKSLRDQANKARIDYRVNMTRGLQSMAEKNIQTLQRIQDLIVEKSANIDSTSPEYIFVLANVKEKERQDGNLSGYIAIYDIPDIEQVDLIQVTTPLYNNAVMMTEAMEGIWENPASQIENLNSSNPIVNFILNSHPK